MVNLRFEAGIIREEAEQQIKLSAENLRRNRLLKVPSHPVLTAPAANAAATQMLNGVAAQLNAQIQAEGTRRQDRAHPGGAGRRWLGSAQAAIAGRAELQASRPPQWR